MPKRGPALQHLPAINPAIGSRRPARRFGKLRILAATAALLACAPAQAWTLLPGVPQAVTVFLHVAGGYATAAYLDSRGSDLNAEVVAGGIGLAKELSDLNFSPADFIAWPLGALVYRHASKSPYCFDMSEYYETYWYMDKPEGCVGGLRAPAQAVATRS